MQPVVIVAPLAIFTFLFAVAAQDTEHLGHLMLTINAKRKFLEVSWMDVPHFRDSYILVTNQLPRGFNLIQTQINYHWVSFDGIVVASIKPDSATGKSTTTVLFDYALSQSVTTNTSCYAYWASYVTNTGTILQTTCLKAHPRWMQELRPFGAKSKLNDLFIPGTHNSGAYKRHFNPLFDSKSTQFTLTQDDDVRSQLMHGVRYLDIHVGYFNNTAEKFFIYNGREKTWPLRDIVAQVRAFVLETNEIVIFDVTHFSENFDNNLSLHKLLVQYLVEKFENVFVSSTGTWSISLRFIWALNRNVVLAYNRDEMVQAFPKVLFSAESYWCDAENWPNLNTCLHKIRPKLTIHTKAVAVMAVLTPNISNADGSRKLADDVNVQVTRLYCDELGGKANIVAVDFIRGTNLVDVAIYWNKRKAQEHMYAR